MPFDPVLDLDADDSNTVGTGYSAAYTAGGAAVAICDTDVMITDADAGDDIVSLVVAITNAEIGDMLNVGTLPAGITVDPTSTATMVKLVAAPGTSADSFEAAIRAITYSSSSNDPTHYGTHAFRYITVVVNDGEGDGNAAGASIAITAADPGEPLVGDGGDNSITGTSQADLYLLQQGGNDTVSGLESDDRFYFGAALTANDIVDGGAGSDSLILQGDYSAGLNLNGNVTGVEVIALLSGNNTAFGDPGTNFYDYSIAISDAIVAAGETLTVDGASLRVGEDLTVNGSAESDGSLLIYAGKGTDTLTGGAQDDVFVFGPEGRFSASDTVDGGAGNDSLVLRGDYTIDFNWFGFGSPVEAIETIALISSSDERYGAVYGAQFDYALTWKDSLLAAGQTINIDAALLQANESLSFDGSGETNGYFRLTGGEGADTLTGGAGSDILSGGLNADTLTGGGGSDTFRYYSAAESTSAGRDGIQDFASGDVIDLSAIDADTGTDGHQAFNFVGNAAFSNTAAQLRYENISGQIWLVQGDTNGDGVSDFETIVVTTDGDPITSSDFVLTQANVINGTDGNDRLIGDEGNDAIYGLGGADYLTGGDGDDLINGGEGAYDRAGWYRVDVTSGATVDLRLQGQAQYTGSQGWDTLVGIENLSGTAFADSFTGDDNDNWLWGSNPYLFGELISTTNDDTLDGQGGNDLLTVGTGNHTLIGGDGIDSVDFSNNGGPETGIIVSLLAQGGAQDTGAGTWTLTGIENLSSGDGDDILEGDSNANVLAGAAGSDILDGGGGNDRLYGDGAIGIDSLSTGPITEFPEDSRSNNGVADGNDILFGGAGDDLLYGGGGNDRLVGGADNDSIHGGSGNDYITGGFGDDLIDGGDGIDRAGWYQTNAALGGATVDLTIQGAQNTGSQGWDTLTSIEFLSGTPFADTFIGDDNDNTLWGSAATISPGNVSATNDDYLDGAGGNDLLVAGIGNHILIGGSGNDTLSFTENGAAEPGIALALWDNLAQNTGAGTWTLSGFENLFGGIGDDSLEGDDQANIIGGSLGSDAIFGYGGNDTLYGDGYVTTIGNVATTFEDSGTEGGDDQLFGGGGNDTLYGGAGNDFLQANAGNDILYGGIGNDYLGGGTGDDYFDGGDGWDRASFSNGAAGPVTVDLRIEGAQDTGLGLDTLVNIENVNATAFSDTLIGNDGANWLWGGTDSLSYFDTIDGQGGDDLIEIGAGNHILSGGTGNDTLLFNPFAPGSIGGRISLALQGTPQDTGSGMMTLTGFENLSGSSFDDELAGDGNNNILAGSEGNDSLAGGAGDDTLYGDGAFGTDGSPSGPIALYADVAALGGVDGNDTLEGGLGNDQLYGGGGIDTASYASATGSVTALLYDGGFGEAFGAAGYDQLHDIENLTGSAFNDILYADSSDNIVSGGDGHDDVRGGEGNDEVYGGAGDDLLYGNAGDDYLDGGDGYDRAGFFSGAVAGVHVDLNQQGVAQDTGQGMDTLVNIENLSGTQFDDTLIGDDNDNWLWGSAATIGGIVSADNNDTLVGNGGNDLLIAGIGNHLLSGGSGNDTFRFTENGVPETGITLSLLLQGAAQASGNGNWTLTGIENLSGSIAADNLTGDDNANVLAGDLGDDSLSGGDGNDTLYGDGQIMWDGHGTGRSGPITTWADATGNYVGGIAGNDLLEGGLGNDTLHGGGGNDTASYAHASGGMFVDLGSGFAAGADGDDTLIEIENITGSEFDDDITGDGGANIIAGLGGNDGISGGAGDDTIYGGDGNDFLLGDFGENNISVTGNDILDGGNGNDNLRGGLGDDQLYGGANNDLLRGNGGTDYFDGGADDGEGFNGIGDRVSFYDRRATQGVVADLRTGVIANDGFGNAETMVGIESLGADTAFVDTLHGNDDRNFLGGSRGDYLYGYGGNDYFQMGAAAAVVDGGLGTDVLGLDTSGGWLTPDSNSDGLAEIAAAASSGWTVDLNAGNLVDGYGNIGTVAGIENVNGSALGDTLVGDAGVNVLNGFDGDDLLEGRGGNDTLDGGNGIDTASYANASGGVTVTLGAGGSGSSSGADGVDTLIAIENVTGSAFNDNLNGNGADNVLTGGDGHDSLRGNGGNDSLYGGSGDDFIYGNAGNDLIDGGAGYDRAGYFSGATAGVHVDLRIVGAQDTGQGLDTLVGIEHVSGTAFADTLIGDDGGNWLWGLSDGNADTISGNGGDDLIVVGYGDHLLSGGSGIDTFAFSTQLSYSGVNISLALQGAAQNTNVGAMTLEGFENLSGFFGNDILTGDGLNNILGGEQGNDTLSGGGGDDALYGDGWFNIDTHGIGGSGPIIFNTDATLGIPGNDLLEGGLGNDLLNGGGGIDTASYAHASGGVFVDLGSGSASGADGNDTLVAIENITGSEFADNITGDGGANVIDGLGGIDTISGGAGDDTIYGGDGNDLLFGDFGENIISVTGNDILDGGNGNDSLRGGLGDDQLYGGANNDLLRGNGGTDYFDGGADDGEGVNGIGDRVSFFEQRATQGVTADLRTGVIANDGFGNVETMVGIESLGADTAFVDTFYGNDGRNYLAANRGDYLYGFGGDDILSLNSAAAVADGGDGIDRLTLFISNGWLLPDADANGLAELAAAATAGWSVNLATGVTVDGYGNVGTVTGIENIDGTFLADTLVGDSNANVLNGLGGDDVLTGGVGNDTLDGGADIDTASYVNASGAVTVTLTTSGGSSSGADGNDTLISIENVIGGAFNDVINGNGGPNRLEGGAGHDKLSAAGGNDMLYGGIGDDTLSGGAGNDLFDGGAGTDRASFFGSSVGVIVNLNTAGAQNTGQGNDTFVGIENLAGTQFADTLIGDGNDNWLWGFASSTVAGSNANNDTLNGGGGNDLLWAGRGNQTLIGGTGNDTVMYNENFSSDVAVTITLLNPGTAQNTGQGTWTLTGIENLVGGTANDTLTGDGLNNILCGGAGTDTLNGGVGNDTLYGDGEITVDDHGTGGSGPIIIVGDAIAAYGGIAGNDILNGGDGDDFMYGGAGNDILKGDKDNDTLYGGTGSDTLTGGQGNDRYVIEANSGADTISGFAHLVDKIVFDTSSGVTSYAQLSLTKVGGTNTLVSWGNGNSITITGLKPTDLSAADFQFNASAAGFEHVPHDYATSYAVPHDVFL